MNKDKEMKNYFSEKYNIAPIILSRIIKKYGSIEEFRKVYIQALIDGNYKDIIPDNLEDKLVTSFDVISPDLINRKDEYFTCLQELCGQEVSDIEFINSNNIRNAINQVLYNRLSFKESRVFRLTRGLSGEKCSVNEIAKKYSTSLSNMYNTKNRANKKVSKHISEYKIYSEIQKDNKVSARKREEFIRRYFENHDIFYNAENFELDEQTREELLNIYNEGKEVLANKNYILKNSKSQREVELFVRRVEQESNIDCSEFNDSLDEKLEFLIESFKGTYDIYLKILEQREFLTALTDEEKIDFIQRNIGEKVNVRDFFWHYPTKETEEMVTNFKANFGNEEIEISKFDSYHMPSNYLNNIIHKGLIQKDMSEEIQDIQRRKTEISIQDEENKVSITELDINAKAFNALKRANIKYIEDLLAKDKKDIDRIRNLGEKGFTEVAAQVHALGYKFKWEEEQQGDNESVNNEKTGIEELNLDARAINALKREKITNIEDLLAMNKTDLIKIRNIGKNALDKLIYKVHEAGYKFKCEEEEQKVDDELEEYIQKLKSAYAKLDVANQKYNELKTEIDKKQEAEAKRTNKQQVQQSTIINERKDKPEFVGEELE